MGDATLSAPVRQHGAALLLLGLAALGCRKAEAPPQPPAVPSVRLYLLSNLAGALEPCGCRKDMLGGIDHAAALIAASRAEAPQRLLLAAGPTLFQDPQLDPARGDQDRWKAAAIADSLADLQLGAWAPGVNDFAAGASTASELAARSRAKLLAANLHTPGVPFASTASFEVGGYRVGVAGIGASTDVNAAATDPSAALAEAARSLQAAGAQIRVALVAAARGDGLRLAEKVPGFSVLLLGKSQEAGDANDAPAPPELVGDTLVVQTSNHLQTLAYVDFFVKGDDFSFQDAMGIQNEERRESLERRITDLERRIAAWRAEQPPPAERISSAERDRQQLAQQLRALSVPVATSGSVFRYHLVEVREGAGTQAAVAGRMQDYYKRVNTHNREAFQDRTPAPAPAGSAHYVGSETCSQCHNEADTFWHKTQHASAYQTLATQFKEFNLDCVGCHVTGYNRPGGSTVTHVEKLKDVQCEACHGPGSRHAESAGSTELIQRRPEASVCRGCHHTPHVADDWSIEQAWPHIVGPGHGQGSKAPSGK
ncbi:MAG TPA: multiheme c-type cytochrome [Polyangiaceae bacterium]|jgi:hypothetical protein|nr:multiheme c-type cytochrome [Polyangiaceae bacterium]